MSELHHLPPSAQSQIQLYLETGNFRAAKELYDYFLARNNDRAEENSGN